MKLIGLVTRAAVIPAIICTFLAFSLTAQSAPVEVAGLSSFPYQAKISIETSSEYYRIGCEDQYLDSASISLPARELQLTLHTLAGWVMQNKIDKIEETKRANSFIKFYGLDSGYSFVQFDIDGVICSVNGKNLENLYRKII